MSDTDEIMEEDPWLKYTTYSCKEEWLADQRGELGRSDDYEGDEVCCFCIHYDGEHCTKEWNNADPAYYEPSRDDKKLYDSCEDFEPDYEVLKEFCEQEH